MQKNIASQKWVVFAFDETDNTAKTGDANQITAEISKDGGAGGGNITDTNPTELEDGYYVFGLEQGETNADLLLILPESSTNNIQVIGVPGAVWTTEPNMNKLSVDSNGRIDVIKVAGTTQTANDMSGDVDAILTDTGSTIPGTITTAQNDLDKITGASGVLIDTDAVDAGAIKADAVVEIAAGVWDRVITKANHSIANSAGKKLRGIEHVTVLHEGQARGDGGGNNTIELATTASAVNNWYKDDWVMLVEGTGENQMHHIESYVGSTRIATLGENWFVNPDNSTDYVIIAQSSGHIHRFEQDAKDEINAEMDTALADVLFMKDTTIASVDTADTKFILTDGLTANDGPNSAICSIYDATGEVWSGPRKVVDYIHGSKLVEIDADTPFALQAGDRVIIWNVSYATTASAGSVTQGNIDSIADAVWDEAEVDHVSDGSMGKKQRQSDRTGR